jgi:NAD dependent epimerase/dehydratase
VGFWEGRRTLVTGAGGFIGGHVAVALSQAGASVRGLCRYNSRGDRGTLDWCPKEETDDIDVQFGDLRDPESIQRAVNGVEIVFHLAAQVAIPYSYLNPRDFFETNVTGTLNVAQAALAADVGRVVHLSTSEVYGVASAFPITEQALTAPRSPYAASKVGADAVMAGWHASFGLPVATARPFNTYGPRQSTRAIVPTIVTQAISGRAVRLGSLHPRRDLTFVSDTVSGLIAIAEAGDAVLGRTLQLGRGEDVSIGELVALVSELTGHQLEVVLDPERVRPSTSEVSRLVCDHSLMTELTGWTPAVDLRTGVLRTLEWISMNTHRFRPSEYTR